MKYPRETDHGPLKETETVLIHFFKLLTLLQMSPVSLPLSPSTPPQHTPLPGLHHIVACVPGPCIYVLWLISASHFKRLKVYIYAFIVKLDGENKEIIKPKQ